MYMKGSFKVDVSVLPFQGELLNPCRCDGSVRYTHQLCLLKWISERGSWTCELCCYRYHVIAIKMKKPCQVICSLKKKVCIFIHFLKNKMIFTFTSSVYGKYSRRSYMPHQLALAPTWSWFLWPVTYLVLLCSSSFWLAVEMVFRGW